MEEQAKRSSEFWYLVFVSIVGVWLLISHIPNLGDWAQTGRMLFMVLLIAIGETASVPVGSGTVSVSLPLAYTAAVLYGQNAGIWIAALGTLRKKDLQGKVPLLIVLFNRAMITISVFMFCETFQALGGHYGGISFPSGIIPMLSADFVCTLVNAALVTIQWALKSGRPFLSVWKTDIQWSLPSEIALSPVALLMVLAAQQIGPYLLILFYVPLMVSKYSLDKYVELRSAYKEMAAALSNAIDARDSYTRGHSERVSEYAALLAQEMKLPDDEIDIIRYVGLLHDVGKVGIRDAIMKKPGRFTLEEYEEMKSHSTIGADMLAGLKFLGKGQDWVRYHHERWDGKGFPKGLSGEEIPLEARILACADSFDAMTTDRPYKSKMDFEAAKQEIVRCSGTQFDPKVVSAMVKVIDKLIASGEK